MRRIQTTILALISVSLFSAGLVITASASTYHPSAQSQASTMAATEVAGTMAATESVQATAAATQASAETATPESTDQGTAVATAQVDMGYLRVIHAAAGAPAIDVYMDTGDTPAVTNLMYGSATNLMQMPAQKYHVVVRAGSTKPDSTPIVTIDVDLAANTAINVVMLGGLADKTAPTLATFVTDISNTQGKARFELFNASPDAPAVDLLSGTSVAASNIAFGKGIDKPLIFDSGMYDFSIVPTGKTDPVLIDLKGSKLEADSIYTIVVIGDLKTLQPLILTSVSPDVSEVPTEAPAEATAEATMAATEVAATGEASAESTMQATMAATVAATLSQ